MIIRPAILQDAQTIAEIHAASRQNRQQKGEWQSWLQETEAVIAGLDGRDIGFCAYGRVRTRLAGDRGPIPRFAGEIYALYVHPDYWRQGIGRALLRAGFDGLRQGGMPSALLWVQAKNDPAIALYLSEGGEKCGKRMIEIEGKTVKETAIGFRQL